MKDGFIKVACATPKIKVADVDFNVEIIKNMMLEASSKGAKIIVFPELSITGYTCQDLFYQHTLLDKAKEGLGMIVKASANTDAVIFTGLPYELNGKLYNVAVAIQNGKLLAIIPKENIPNYGEFYEVRHFAKGFADVVEVEFDGSFVPMGQNIIFTSNAVNGLQIACEICEDLWVSNTPSTRHAMNGANVIVNLSAGNEIIGKSEYRRMLVEATSARLICGYVYTDAGEGESTQDLVFPGHNIIAENGSVISESKCFTTGIIYGDIDIERIRHERRRITTFTTEDNSKYVKITLDIKNENTEISRKFHRTPFVPSDDKERNNRCNHILNIQSYGLKKRIEHINAKTAVVGLSGGLDSTLAMIVAVKAFDLAGRDRKNLIAVTMPCFGTTNRTYNNACDMARALGVTLKEIRIDKSVRQHFEDIGHDENDHSVTYENCQARERTQVLMDIANKDGGIVIGTGDMSELALGWATYNGDHMSMYGVNAGVPKTLVRYLVKYYADTCDDEKLRSVLYDVLDTPVSPELLPPKDGVISQVTEDLVGPYELHDFFLYYMLRCGFSPKKIYRIATKSFESDYDKDTILKWLKNFYRRFFSQQFKRSCLPDGPKVGSIAVSPRGDLRMPSDAMCNTWMEELDEIH